MRVGQEGRARGIGLISFSESALKVTYGNVIGGGGRKFSPAAGFRPRGDERM